MNIDPNLMKLITGRSPFGKQPTDTNPVFRKLLEAQRYSQGAIPDPNQFNGIIDPGDIPNSRFIDPDTFVGDLATQQSAEQPNYRPEIPNNLDMSGMTEDQVKNILRLLKNYQVWKQGESH